MFRQSPVERFISAAISPLGVRSGVRSSISRISAIMALAAATACVSGCVHVAEFKKTSTRSLDLGRGITAVNVRSLGGRIDVLAGNSSSVRLTETLHYNRTAPQMEKSVQGGELTLKGDPSCNHGSCRIDFRLEVPAALTARLDSSGGAITVRGLTEATNADSHGGSVTAVALSGPVTVNTSGGRLTARNISATIDATTAGGSVHADAIVGKRVTVRTSGGDASLVFSAVPDRVDGYTNGGSVKIHLVAGSYAVTTDNDGGDRRIAVPIDPASPHKINLATSGGSVSVLPTAG